MVFDCVTITLCKSLNFSSVKLIYCVFKCAGIKNKFKNLKNIYYYDVFINKKYFKK